MGSFAIYNTLKRKFLLKRMNILIPITKEEKARLMELYPNYKYPRTMKQDSKRHHYYCTENEELMRVIADTNPLAAELVKEYDKKKQRYALKKKD